MTDVPTSPAPSERSTAGPLASGRRHRKWWILGGAAALLVVAGVAVWYLVFRDTAPPAVNIEKASESVDNNKTGSKSGIGSSLDGTWKVDTSVGSFDDFSSAFVGYRVNEELVGVGAQTAFGRTPDVSGTLVVKDNKATTVDIKANLSTLQSDESFRDGAIRDQALQTNQFPEATFTLTKPIDFRTVPAEGKTVKVDGTGKLTLHGVTKNVTVPLEAKLANGVIVVIGQIDILFADFDILKPVALRVLSIEDRGVMEFQLFFSKK